MRESSADVFRRLRDRGRRNASSTGDAPAEEEAPAQEVVSNDFPACLAREFPEDFELTWRITSEICSDLPGLSLEPLERHSPALAGFDWDRYFRCSAARMVRVSRALRTSGLSGPLLDVGSYFGNFSLLGSALGFDVTALDSYERYGSTFDKTRARFGDAGVSTMDFSNAGEDLSEIPGNTFSAVLLLGVVEHVPHTPRLLLEALDRVLTPGGLLVIDTPNVAYVAKRWQLAKGESIYPPLEAQYFTEIPYEGHHREYTIEELTWMLERLGHEDIMTQTFDYSRLTIGEYYGDLLEMVRAAEDDPTMREIILSTSRKPETAPVSASIGPPVA
jgi:2-polyprenyl-3-methyl-5-hydroxy-6-metoxy-1,4-benzoquinol methylase